MKEHKVFIVYITKNIVNNKYYIGVHGTTDPEGFDGYLGCGVYVSQPSSYNNPYTPFQCAVKKYGPKKFIRSVISVFDTEEEAYNLEKILVTKKIVESKLFYNVQLGGGKSRESTVLDRIIYQYNLDGSFLKEWILKDAADMYSVTPLMLTNTVCHRYRTANFYWSYNKVDQLNMQEYSTPNTPKYIYEYSSEGVCIGIYDSLQHTPNKGHIRIALQTGRPYRGNYYSYTLYEEYKPKVHQSYKNKSLYIYGEDGGFIKEVVGVKAACDFIGIKSRANIYDAILLKRPCRNYKILEEKVDRIEPFSKKTKEKKINVYDIYGTLLKTYDSVNAAIRDLHLDNTSARRVIKGTQRQTKGYILKESNT